MLHFEFQHNTIDHLMSNKQANMENCQQTREQMQMKDAQV